MTLCIIHHIIGSPEIVSITLNRTVKTLTCTSTGGPPSTITWEKNDMPINDSLYQIIVDTERATIMLMMIMVTIFVGNFTCQISNVRSMAVKKVHLNG
jgi:hypothetical protein